MTEALLLTKEDFHKLISELTEIKALIKQNESSTTNDKKIYTNKEVAKLLNLSTCTLSRFRKEGRIEFTKGVGSRKVYYTQEHIDAYLELDKKWK